MVDRVSGRTVLVTGAGQGMGAGIARALAAEGANVAVGDINVAAADAVAAALGDEGHRAISVGMDVTMRDDVRAAIAQTVREFGRLDVMFNNAGLNKPMQFLDVTEENWNLVMDVNALGVLIGTQEAAKQMIAQGGGGKIVNTASIASRQGYAEFVPYCASKFAVVAIIQAGARALAGDHITVNGFSPGVVETPLWAQLDKDMVQIHAAEKEGDAFAAFASGALLGRAAQVADIVPTAVFLASADSEFITGQVMAIDGGMVLV
ncbi:SDR family oxidoreductase [Mycobacterium hodleri]|uniref:SDR family NAD(P)-dependent oxidoreductase n=1 Tax=Mycolicibacterium hodleri TaxID=49897 RepID=UPI0021F32CF9|nr:SDR family NAD(P)-dependent oxidoreductase [Mycolicibacterium hodleri]MCV7136357.1 SDR family oxidoreductase [Mycolicibacterium hodleri]